MRTTKPLAFAVVRYLLSPRVQSVLLDRLLYGVAPLDERIHFVLRERQVDETLRVSARRDE